MLEVTDYMDMEALACTNLLLMQFSKVNVSSSTLLCPAGGREGNLSIAGTSGWVTFRRDGAGSKSGQQVQERV